MVYDFSYIVLAKRRNAKIHEDEPSTESGRVKVDTMVRTPRIKEVLSSLYANILDTRIIYYPFYVALLSESEEGTIHEKIVVIDGLSGEEVEGFTRIIASEAIDNIRASQGLKASYEEKE
jgi:hypothetical protein